MIKVRSEQGQSYPSKQHQCRQRRPVQSNPETMSSSSGWATRKKNKNRSNKRTLGRFHGIFYQISSLLFTISSVGVLGSSLLILFRSALVTSDGVIGTHGEKGWYGEYGTAVPV